MTDYPATSVPMFVNKGKPKTEFSWREHNIQRRARKERMAQYALEKAERDRMAAEEAAEEDAAKVSEDVLERLRAGSDNESSSASSVGYEIGDLGSPSPGAKARAERKVRDYKVFERMGVTDEHLVGWRARMDANVRVHEEEKRKRPVKVVEDPSDPYVIRRRKLEAEDAMIKKIAASTTPMFIKSTTDVAFLQAAEAARELERRTKGIPEPPKSEAEMDPSWGSRKRGHPDWVQKILHPELYEEELVPFDGDVADSKADALLPSIEVGTRPIASTRRVASPIRKTRTAIQPEQEVQREEDNVQDQVTGQHHMYTEESASRSPLKSPVKNTGSMWNGELDFTEESIEVSMSPQLQIRRFDRMREQEHNNESARHIASTQLERIRERNSEERSSPAEDVRRSNHQQETSEIKNSPIPKVELLRSQSNATTSKEPSDREFSGRTVDASRSTSTEKGIRIPNTPVTVYGAGTYQDRHPPKSEEELRRIREESYDALRQLSRSISRSPDRHNSKTRQDIKDDVSKPEPVMPTFKGAGNDEEEGTMTREHKEDKSQAVTTSNKNDIASSRENDTGRLRPARNSQSNSRPNSLSRSDIDPEERIAAEAKLFELQDNKSEKNSTRASSPPQLKDEFDIVDETPKPNKPDSLTMPTPRVIGAFVETPAPTVRKPQSVNLISASGHAFQGVEGQQLKQEQQASTAPSVGANSDKFHPSSLRLRPPLINTAKRFSVADDIRRLKLEAGIDDSMDDFDSFLGKPVKIEDEEEEEPGSPVDKLISGILKDKKLLDEDALGQALSDKERERQLERVIMERMNKHLKMTSSSLRDTRHGIERIEKQVQTTIEKPSTKQPVGETVYLGVPLAHRAADDTIYIKLPIPRLWKYQSHKSEKKNDMFSRNWKLTWLGLIVAIFAAWYVAESVTCDIYCHPLMASENTWHPDDPFFPYAIPTKLDQWTGEYASAGMYYALEYLEDLWTGQSLRGTRFRGAARPSPTIREIWWNGRSGPRGIIHHEATRTHSMFADEVI